MAVKMLSCMSSKNLEEAMESNYEKERTPRAELKPEMRRMKSFTCHVLIHPPWTFLRNGVSSTQAGPDENEAVSARRGWKSFLASLQCPRPPLRSTDLKVMAIKLKAGAYKHSCKPCTASVYDQEASHAVHPVASLDTNSENNFSLPADQYRHPTPLKDDQGSSHGSNHGSNRGDGSVSARSVHASLSDQKYNSKNSSHYESPTYAAGKVSEESRSLNAIAPPGTNIPGTEWFSQVELGVFITFVTLSNGCNALKRIRFSRDIFSKKEAESWWAENGNRVRAIYNVPAFERASTNDHPTSSSEEEASGASGYATPAYSPGVSRGASMRDSIAGHSPGVSRGASMRDASIREASMRDASMRESSMRDAVSAQSDSVTDERPHESEAHESEEGSERTIDDTEQTTWVEEDVPGVYLTLMNLAGGGRELKRVRFSREKFTEKQAKIWWDENRGRIHKQYL